MSHNYSPHASPAMATYGRVNNNRSPTPPLQPQSKRDKRRTLLSERMNEMIATFSSNHYDHYFAQLAAVQCDINLIMRADPFSGGPLEDSPEAIAQLVDDARREATRNKQISAEAEESFEALKGRHYSHFVNEVNAAMEERDAGLTQAFGQYQDGLDELRKTYQYKVQLAHEEHQLLSKTLRERLIQTVTQKKARLVRDKEQLDIADSNALLLNPNQFSLGNPASPGGPQNPRKTRHTRLRGAEIDEAGMGAEGNKRKRKVALEEPDEPPATLARLGDNRISTPFRDTRTKITHSQYEAPVYSIDRLFTEKELALNLGRSREATSAFFARANAQHHQNGASVNGNPSAASVDPIGDTKHIQQDPEMDDQATPTYHATRSTRAGPSANPLDSLANAATALAPFVPALPLPPIVAVTSGSGKSGPPHAPSVPGLAEIEVQYDLSLMRQNPEDPSFKPALALFEAIATQRPGSALLQNSAPNYTATAWRPPPTDGVGEEGHVAAAMHAMAAGGGSMYLGYGGQGMARVGSGMGFANNLWAGVPMSRNTSIMSEGGAGNGVSASDYGIRPRRGIQ